MLNKNYAIAFGLILAGNALASDTEPKEVVVIKVPAHDTPLTSERTADEQCIVFFTGAKTVQGSSKRQ